VAITSTGVRTDDGTERRRNHCLRNRVNMVAMASRLNIRGREGANLAEAWADETAGLPGYRGAGFPNSS